MIKGTIRGRNPNTCSREEVKRERGREDHSRRLGPLIYLTLPFVGLRLLARILPFFACASSCSHIAFFCLCLGGRTLAPSVHAPCMYMQ